MEGLHEELYQNQHTHAELLRLTPTIHIVCRLLHLSTVMLLLQLMYYTLHSNVNIFF